MDPTLKLCEIPHTDIEGKNMIPEPLFQIDEKEIQTPTESKINILTEIEFSTLNYLSPHYIDSELLTKRSLYKFEITDLVRNQVYKSIPSPFKLDGAIKLANIDAIFHIIPELYDTLKYTRSGGQFTFGAIADGPGGFTEYLQYRYPDANVIGMTLKSLPWDLNVINKDKFISIYGQDLTGNILTSYKDYINYIQSKYSTGLNFICADAVTNSETSMSKLILVEAIICLKCLRMGQNIVIRLGDTFSRLICQIIYCICLCFEKSYIFKPVSSDPDTNEKYLICIGSLYQKKDIIPILEKLYETMLEDKRLIKSFIKDGIPSTFKDNILKINNMFLQNQIESLDNISKFLEATPLLLPLYDLRKTNIVWNLPESIYI